MSLHIHERIDPSSIMQKILRDPSQKTISSFFKSKENDLPLYKAIEFYKHMHNWANRFIAGDSTLVMNSLLEKEGMRGKIQMVYIDPPYGIKYSSNFQPFVCKQSVREVDSDLTKEPETILAFRDTWELGIHSYLTYLRERMFLAKQLLTETGSCFVQISDENIHLVRNIMDETFGAENFVSLIAFRTKGVFKTKHLPKITDYIVWYAKNKLKIKYNEIFTTKEVGSGTGYTNIELKNGERRKMNLEEQNNPKIIPKGSKIYQTLPLTTAFNTPNVYSVKINGKNFSPGAGRGWKTNESGMKELIRKNRVEVVGKTPRYVNYYDDYPVQGITNIWTDTQGATNKRYVVQTANKVIQRCLIMTTDPGDLVFDPTCGSGTVAFIAEKFGRRWITCDTSRVAIAVARQRLMTAVFDYYKLAHNYENKNEVSNGFEYDHATHITLGQLAQNQPYGSKVLLDRPVIDKTKHRISGPFTVESIPSPTVKSIDLLYDNPEQTLDTNQPQQQWRDELLKTGIRGKNNQKIEFMTIDVHPTSRWIHAVGSTKEKNPKNVAISFGPEYAPLDQRQVELALEEARKIVPKITMLVFAAMHFDPEASKNIDEINWNNVTVLNVEMNKDLLTSDLKKSRSSNESFWLKGKPDITVMKKNKTHIVRVNGYDYFDIKNDKIISGDTDKIVMWMLDTDYDGRSVYPQQIFFPMKNSTGSKGLSKLSKTLQTQIDDELITKFYGAESIPFEAGPNKRIAVKIIDDQAIESLGVIEIGE